MIISLWCHYQMLRKSASLITKLRVAVVYRPMCQDFVFRVSLIPKEFFRPRFVWWRISILIWLVEPEGSEVSGTYLTMRIRWRPIKDSDLSAIDERASKPIHVPETQVFRWQQPVAISSRTLVPKTPSAPRNDESSRQQQQQSWEWRINRGLATLLRYCCW